MPLIDAYIKCDDIAGSYKAGAASGQAGSNRANLEATHDGWSEITSFDYDLGSDGHPKVNIKKIIDSASNALYLNFLKNNSRQMNKGSEIDDSLIDQITIELCRWVDSDNDGMTDLLLVFLSYVFKKCRFVSYSTDINFEADDLPEESLSFSFREMEMHYYYIVRSDDGTILTQEHSGFSCDFAEFESVDVPLAANQSRAGLRHSKAGRDFEKDLGGHGHGGSGGSSSRKSSSGVAASKLPARIQKLGR